MHAGNILWMYLHKHNFRTSIWAFLEHPKETFDLKERLVSVQKIDVLIVIRKKSRFHKEE